MDAKEFISGPELQTLTLLWLALTTTSTFVLGDTDSILFRLCGLDSVFISIFFGATSNLVAWLLLFARGDPEQDNEGPLEFLGDEDTTAFDLCEMLDELNKGLEQILLVASSHNFSQRTRSHPSKSTSPCLRTEGNKKRNSA